jgi:hypothetical protein
MVARILASKVLFRHPDQEAAVIESQWASLAVALLNVSLVVIFWYVPVPEGPTDDLKELAKKRSAANNSRICGIPVVYLTLALGVWSQFWSMAEEEAYTSLWRVYQVTLIPRCPHSLP